MKKKRSSRDNSQAQRQMHAKSVTDQGTGDGDIPTDPYGLTWIRGCFEVPITSDGTDSSVHLPAIFPGHINY